MSTSTVALPRPRTSSESLITDFAVLERLQPAKARATSAPMASVNLIPTVEEDLRAIARPCDPRTGESLGQRMDRRAASLRHRQLGEEKNHGHRTAPLKKRGDTAKKRQKARAHLAKVDRRIARISLSDQLDEVSHLLCKTRLATGLI